MTVVKHLKKIRNIGDLKENKIYTHKGEALSVYTLDNEPLLMEMKCGTLIPYLYAFWKFDLDIATLHVAPFLLEKFAGGADLMAPGIIIPPAKGSHGFSIICLTKSLTKDL